MTNLSSNEYVAKELIKDGATSKEIRDAMEVSMSYVYDLIAAIRRKGIDVDQDSNGRYYIEGERSPDEPVTTVGNQRSSSEADALMTRRVRKYLATMEHEALRRLEGTEPARADGGLVQRSDGTDLVIHAADDHFGELTENQYGEVMVDSEITQERVYRCLDETMAEVERRRDTGEDFDTAHLLLNGDHVTNEVIFEGQAHEIDEDIQEQLDRASEVYWEYIQTLADEFPSVQVTGTVGNHGEFRGSGASNAANADGILYMMLDKNVRASSLDNVTFAHSNRAHYINFNLRDWNGHMRHGHDATLEHIGTSAGKQRWLQWLTDHDFDIAFRGHFHQLKEEPIAGRPVLMGGTVQEQTEFEESHAMSSRPVRAIHGVTDQEVLSWTKRIYFG